MKLVKLHTTKSHNTIYVNPEHVLYVRSEGAGTRISFRGDVYEDVNEDMTYVVELLRVGSIDPKCADCVFYAHDTCRKRSVDVFPIRAKDDWCGEYQEE